MGDGDVNGSAVGRQTENLRYRFCQAHHIVVQLLQSCKKNCGL